MLINDSEIMLSVIVPCCNVERFVGQCLRSIQDQTFKSFEVLCINDGSKDNTLSEIQSFCSSDIRFHVVDKPNSGYGDSMNLGLSLARGKYVAIIESDDYIEATMFEDLIGYAEKYNLDIARAGFYYTYSDSETPETFPYIAKNIVLKPIDYQAIFYQPPSIWASIYRREFLVESEINFLPTPGASFQDTSFAFKCYMCCARFMLVQNCFVHYRQHENNSVKSDGKLYAVCDEWDEIIKFVSVDKERFNKVKYLIGELFNNTYRWNYNRLTGKGRKIFIKRWSSDIRKYEKLGVKLPSHIGKRRYIEYFIVRYAPFLYPMMAKVSFYLRKVGI